MLNPRSLSKLGYGLELVGGSLRVSLNPKERDWRYLFDFARHVLWRQREDEGRGVIVRCAISKVRNPLNRPSEPIGSNFGSGLT